MSNSQLEKSVCFVITEYSHQTKQIYEQEIIQMFTVSEIWPDTIKQFC